ncbi:hypothetical protein LOK49_LG07G00390 [Camellia lanceoleosa]|uniref:Uncharacterized protein n=1 Tax=Camellia lanceoleosa TaxID=1840588 RepID=A0ACC0H0F4_9ERIC|nr:hypothetical protein LOK49_LG07G00390 [Camellia lanceoleosa]
MAHSSNLPCDRDDICMICKKKSAEDLRNSSSNSSSSVSNNPPVDSMPFMETKERSFYDTGYSMDDIWEDIALSESDRMKTVCETIMASPIWNYCPPSPDILWIMEENEESSPNSKNSVTNSASSSSLLVRRLQGQKENAAGEEVAPTPKKIFQLLNQETRT